MRSQLLFGALGLALVVGSLAAGARTVIAPGFGPPVGAVIVPQQPPIPTATVAQPATTIQTTEIVRSVRQVPAHRPAPSRAVWCPRRQPSQEPRPFRNRSTMRRCRLSFRVLFTT